MKTKFDSFVVKDMCKGCKFCLKGEKLVLFITGKCSRNCPYCSLSNNRKNTETTYANERPCKSPKDAIEEARESNARGAGITGGDPLIALDKTIKYAKALKKEFGRAFHIHIYLPTTLVTEDKIKKLSKYIDEIRFHPLFLQTWKEKSKQFDLNKIKIAKKYFKRSNIGCEMPMFPDKKEEILYFIKEVQNIVGFVNLNELELSETNFNWITSRYTLKENGYVVAGSKEAGISLLKKLKNSPLKIHLCTAKTKDAHQFKNRLLKHKILPYGYRNKDGTVIYFAVYAKNQPLAKIEKELKKYKEIYKDEKGKRIILSRKILDKVLKEDKFKVARVLEYPTFDRTIIEFWEA